MVEVRVRITNMTEIRRAFLMAPGLMTIQLDTAIRRSAFIIEAQSKQNTPVDTGRLRASTRSIFGQLRGEIGTHVFYDVYVHEGTRFMRSRPYLLNAVLTTAQKVQLEFKNAVERVLKEIGGRV